MSHSHIRPRTTPTCALLFAAALVAGCGGGGDAGSPPPAVASSPAPAPTPAPPRVQTTIVQVQVDQALQQASALKIASVASLIDSPSSLASGVRVAPAGAMQLVFGFDSSGEIALAARPSNGIAVLSGESTVLALAHLALSTEFPAHAGENLLNAIRSHPTFASIANSIGSATSAGQNGLTGTEAPARIAALAADVRAQITSTASAKARPMLLPEERVEPPFVLLSMPTSDISVAQYNTSQLTVRNGSRVVVSVQRNNVLGAPLLGDARDAGPGENVEYASTDHSVSFDLSLHRDRNVLIGVEHAVSLVVGQLNVGCLSSYLVDQVLRESSVDIVVNPTTEKIARRVVEGLLLDSAKALSSCGFDIVATSAVTSVPIVKLISLVVGAFNFGQWVADVNRLQAPKRVGLCMSDTKLPMSCVRTIELGAQPRVSAPGSTLPVEIRFLGANQASTARPAGLLRLHSSGEQPKFATLLDSLRQIQTIALGTEEVTVLDPATEKNVTIKVEVDQPEFSASELSVGVDETKELALIGQRTRLSMDPDAEGSPLFVELEDKAVAGMVLVNGKRHVKGLKVGETYLAVDSLRGGIERRRVRVKVTPIALVSHVQMIFQGVRCGFTQSASLSVTGGSTTFQEQRSLSPSCADGGFGGAVFGPFPIELVRGVTYSVRFAWQGNNSPLESTNSAYEINSEGYLQNSFQTYGANVNRMSGEYVTTFVAK